MRASTKHWGVFVRMALLLSLAACASSTTPDGTADGTWVGTITTEGNVTTVVNESGSVWGGTARLVEEASIGVDVGANEYMFGEVDALSATDDEIYVLDGQVPALRVYGMAGRHLRDIGSEGDGPGEFREPGSLAIGADGHIYVRDASNARITIFSSDGQELDTLPLSGDYFTSLQMVLTEDGTLYNYERIIDDDPNAERRSGMVPRSVEADRDGDPIPPPDFGFEPWRIQMSRENMRMTSSVPFAPGTVWRLSPSGAMIAGVSTDYSFEIQYPDGRVTRIVNAGDEVPIDPEEAAWYKKRATAGMRRGDPEWAWTGNEVPAVKPAYQSLIPDHSGRVWVVRPGPGYHVEGDCNEDPESDEGSREPCWKQTTTWDVFDAEGRFLGKANVPQAVRNFPTPHIRGAMFLASVVDDFGTIVVKRYRLVPPGER